LVSSFFFLLFLYFLFLVSANGINKLVNVEKFNLHV